MCLVLQLKNASFLKLQTESFFEQFLWYQHGLAADFIVLDDGWT